MIAPPDFAIRAAVDAGRRSPCAKSQRGAIVYDPRSGAILGAGWNAQPEPFVCSGSEACRAACGKLCVHAEQRAIREAILAVGVGDLLAIRAGETPRLVAFELVHAKVVDGELVAGGGPSCWQCSREILDVGLAAVWLYEAQRWHDEVPCGTCGAVAAIAQGAGTTGVCERCRVARRYPGLLELARGKTVYDPGSGEWRRYSAEEFHRATAAHPRNRLPLEVRR